jgi:transposase InsO family protein
MGQSGDRIIEVFYNGRRRHSTLGDVSPMEFEMNFVEEKKERPFESEAA